MCPETEPIKQEQLSPDFKENLQNDKNKNLQYSFGNLTERFELARNRSPQKVKNLAQAEEDDEEFTITRMI